MTTKGGDQPTGSDREPIAVATSPNFPGVGLPITGYGEGDLTASRMIADVQLATANAIGNTSNRVQIPSEAITKIGNHTVISQIWLSKQLPLRQFILAGGQCFDTQKSATPSISSTNTRMQCRLHNGVYYWDARGAQWLSKYYGAKIPTESEIAQIFPEYQGFGDTASEINPDTISTLGIAPVGYLNVGSNQIEDQHIGFVSYHLDNHVDDKYIGVLRIQNETSNKNNPSIKPTGSLKTFKKHSIKPTGSFKTSKKHCFVPFLVLDSR